MADNYWTRKRITRRQALVGGSTLALGAAGLALVGCEGEEEGPPPAAGTPAAATPAASPAADEMAAKVEAYRAEALTEQPVTGGTLRLAGWSGGYTGWDPRFGDEWDPAVYYTFTHDRILEFRYGPNTGVAPAYGAEDYTPTASLAESWEQPDQTTVIFSIRRGVRWRDVDPVNGRELVAADAKFSLDSYRSPDATFAESLKPVVTVDAPDNFTLTLETEFPYAPLLVTIATPKYPVLAPEVIERFGQLGGPETLIGTGPWYLETFEEGIRAVFKRNPTYWRGPDGVTGENLPYLETVEAALDPEWSTSVAQFRSGELAAPGNWFGFWGLEGMSLKDIEELRASVPTSLDALFWRVYMDRFMWLRADLPPFNDARVRQAVSMAVDRDAWVQSVYDGRAVKSREFSEVNPWYLPTDQLGDGAQYQEFNPEKARQLLAAAGYPDGFSTKLHTTSASGPALVIEAELVQEELREIAIETEIVNYPDSAAWYAGPRGGNFEEGLAWGYGDSFNEPDPYLDHFRPGHPRNLGHVDDPPLVELIEKQRRALDPEERREILYEIQRHLGVQLYFPFTIVGPSQFAWHSRWKNWWMFEGQDYGYSFLRSWVV